MTSKKKRIISNIAFYLVLVIIYGIAIFAVTTKFTKGTIYFGNSRTDVVLTDSMSIRNENHKDYLSDTSQIQPFDMVVSTKIKEDTELKEKDCVLFHNPNYHNELVVHRIVHIYEEGIHSSITNATKTNFNNEDVFALISSDSEVMMGALDYTSISITCYTSSLYSSYLVISEGKNVVATEVETTNIGDNVYKHLITYKRSSTAPYKTFISRGIDQNVYISSISYNSESKGELTLNASEITFDESNSFKKIFNPYYLYEIRADKSNSSDGIFERSALESKVTNVIPKLGHVVHFLQSIPGIIMLVGLTILITVASFFWNKSVNKKNDDSNSVEKDINNTKETD